MSNLSGQLCMTYIAKPWHNYGGIPCWFQGFRGDSRAGPSINQSIRRVSQIVRVNRILSLQSIPINNYQSCICLDVQFDGSFWIASNWWFLFKSEFVISPHIHYYRREWNYTRLQWFSAYGMRPTIGTYSDILWDARTSQDHFKLWLFIVYNWRVCVYADYQKFIFNGIF